MEFYSQGGQGDILVVKGVEGAKSLDGDWLLRHEYLAVIG